MKPTKIMTSLAAIVIFLLAIGQVCAFAAHEFLFAVTSRNDLISFYSDAPGTILSAHAITGLQGKEKICGIDSRNGTIYGLGSSSRLYVIDPNTGNATQVGTGQFSTLLDGQSFGVDAGPNGVRVVSDLGQHLVVDNTTGSVSVYPDLTYSPGDPYVGQRPVITALGFDTGTGKWYAGDSLKNSFATLDPTTGALSTIGVSGIDFARENGLDISSSSGIMYLASPAASSAPAANLYSVTKNTGLVTLIGLIGKPGDNVLVRGLTVATVPPAAVSTSVPTMTQWGMISIVILLGIGCIYCLRKRAAVQE
jgi:hypothetical protein